ncbi:MULTISPECIES: PLP-dependent aminotransferase family protein [Yersinia pseudotuberculosis complex]|uniref:Transcriptional regulator, GntR family n=1 Tax=Yersinia pseudotuberculosis serotype O:1b (strain IP 31758) TaxID=349747 RepID=A0A0U1R311_YERP3|nr:MULTISPECIES: PLP-dependent aminotransferase family protein [Yersinia pseudotuberculosis complex]ABS49697.1 transcriptional regulator, GntR family [Yersinia pseudotuberculosis IP 31758]AJJ73000.1 aminotransferase class I and II family protein [Yersinia pseudotuberculosis]AJK17135.1 aminotransferase class I and II family protein [Yersinia pseudotuberculosis str. PA3606]MCE4112294.1 PLP-dependent aminotransferase family protein [Yersinia pseudotuberculosis]MCF1163046.1 PLP-dependent aminotran
MRSLLSDLLLQRLTPATLSTVPVAKNKRLYRALRLSILDGSIRAGSRLPASRDLAQELEISRNTVLAAYDQLQAEGYIQTRTGGGTFVTTDLPEDGLNKMDTLPQHSGPEPDVALSTRATHLLNHCGVASYQWGTFMPGVPDVRLFPHEVWRKLQTRLSRHLNPENLTYSVHGGCPQLQQALADYLRIARSVSCTPDQILITAGTHQALDLLAKMLCDPGDHAWIEEPSYWGIRNVLTINGIEVIPVSVDENGMDPLDLPFESRSPHLICVTPSHQYPLGSVMSLTRRQRILALAQQHNCWVVEDDYDSEFRFSGSPIPALQGLIPDAPVIYLGTFSKTLYPGMRISYMVLPRPLAQQFKVAHSELYRGGNGMMQLTLAEFIREGHYASHIRRMRLIYGKRRAALVGMIKQQLGGSFLAEYGNAGLHLILALPESIDDVALSAELEQKGVLVRALSGYYLKSPPRRGLLLGYGCVPEEAMEAVFAPIVSYLRRRINPDDAI